MHHDGFSRHEEIELLGSEHEAVVVLGAHGLPVGLRRGSPLPGEVQERGVVPGPIPHPPLAVPAQVEAQEHPVGQGEVLLRHGVPVAEQQGCAAMELVDLLVGQVGPAHREPELVEAEVLPHPDGERERHHLQEQPTLVTRPHVVEAVAPVGDHPGEHVRPARRALGVAPAPHCRGKGQPFLQGDEVGPVGLEDDALVVEVQLVDDEVLDLQVYALVVGEEAAPDPVGPLAQAEVHARGLDVLLGDYEPAGVDPAGVDGPAKMLVGQDSLFPLQEAAQLVRRDHGQS